MSFAHSYMLMLDFRKLFSLKTRCFFEEPSLAQKNVTSHFTNLDLPKTYIIIYIYTVYYVR